MTPSILYLGDTSLRGAAAYLAGVMTHFRLPFEYVASDQPLTRAHLQTPRSLFVLSDYPAAQLAPEWQAQILAAVEKGAGLLMLGGWESFHGNGGNWDATLLAAALPVQISGQDDRINCDQPALLLATIAHPITANLPWLDRPPTIGGFNAVTAKPSAQVLLEVHRYHAVALAPPIENRKSKLENPLAFKPRDRHTALIVSTHGQGRTAAFAPDVAPHWVGGLVDWGPGRVTAQAPNANDVEVGNLYAQFLRQLVTWAGQLAG